MFLKSIDICYFPKKHEMILHGISQFSMPLWWVGFVGVHLCLAGGHGRPFIQSVFVLEPHHLEPRGQAQQKTHCAVCQGTPVNSSHFISFVMLDLRKSEKEIPLSRIMTVNLAKTRAAITVTAKLSPVISQQRFQEAVVRRKEEFVPRRLMLARMT